MKPTSDLPSLRCREAYINGGMRLLIEVLPFALSGPDPLHHPSPNSFPVSALFRMGRRSWMPLSWLSATWHPSNKQSSRSYPKD